MKKILLLSLLLVSSLFAELEWAESYKEALIQGENEKKIVMVMFSREGCPMCDYMKNSVYEDDAVMEYIENFFVAVEVDLDEHPDKHGYKVFATPTYYFLGSDGQQIGRPMIGGAKPDGFLEKLQEVMKAR